MPGYVLARSGVLNRVTWLIPHAKIQTLQLASTPFQRRHGLTTLTLDTASGGKQGRVIDLDAATAEELMQTLARESAMRGGGRRRRRPS